MMRYIYPKTCLLTICFLVGFIHYTLHAQEIKPDPAMPKGFDPERHMLVKEIRPGMTGYALTVFQGVKIEPLPVKILSVETSADPGRAIVWVECTSERMQHLGPVSGMSGSPVFIWDEDVPAEKRVIGKGGRMLGALAFGYNFSRDTFCSFGVQPIQFMLESSERAKTPKERMKGDQQARAQRLNRGREPYALLDMAYQQGLKHPSMEHRAWRLKLMKQLVSRLQPELQSTAKVSPLDQRLKDRSNDVKPVHKAPKPLSLPLNVGDPHIAKMLSPFFKDSHLRPMGMSSYQSGKPPLWLNPDEVKAEPGGVVSIPIVRGDLDWPATGTITEVLPDGTVLGFGHAMFGEGETLMPMFTGYVNFIQPSVESSFKLGGSLKQIGAIVNDESAAIVGKPGVESRWIPVNVSVKFPDESLNAEYKYEVIDNYYYMASAASFMPVVSFASDVAQGRAYTVSMKAVLTFEGGRTIDYVSKMPVGDMGWMAYELSGIIDSLSYNYDGELKLESMSCEVEVVHEDLRAFIKHASIDKQTVKPGDTITARVRVEPFQDEDFYKEIQLKIPEDAEPGEWVISVAGPADYQSELFGAKSYLMYADNLEELFEGFKAFSDVKVDGLHMIARSPKAHVALRRTPLPPMPDSKLMPLATSHQTSASWWFPTVSSSIETPWVINGAYQFTVRVEKP